MTAVSNSKKVGANVAEFLTFLDANGCLTKNMHIVGHSLGGHIAGFTGQNLKNKPRRITGMLVNRALIKIRICLREYFFVEKNPSRYKPQVQLLFLGLDAAGPLFNDKAADNRLSSDDAGYVDCIHTSDEFGMKNRCGTVDHYPNGGNKQPSCLSASMTSEYCWKYEISNVQRDSPHFRVLAVKLNIIIMQHETSGKTLNSAPIFNCFYLKNWLAFTSINVYINISQIMLAEV